jgi:hypothetical protein
MSGTFARQREPYFANFPKTCHAERSAKRAVEEPALSEAEWDLHLLFRNPPHPILPTLEVTVQMN